MRCRRVKIVSRLVEPQFAILNQEQDRDRCERLGQGREREAGVCGDWRPLCEVCKAIVFLDEYSIIARNEHRGPRRIRLGKGAEERIDEFVGQRSVRSGRRSLTWSGTVRSGIRD